MRWFFHADDKYACVRTAAGKYLIRTPIGELAAALDPERFVHVHRSTIVNLDHLAGTRRDDASRLSSFASAAMPASCRWAVPTCTC